MDASAAGDMPTRLNGSVPPRRHSFASHRAVSRYASVAHSPVRVDVQLAEDVRPSDVPRVPREHAAQLPAAATDEKVLNGHLRQTDSLTAEVPEWYRPAPHGVHADIPGELAYVPTAHGLDTPRIQNVPASHSVVHGV